jgi:hypothetical protein
MTTPCATRGKANHTHDKNNHTNLIAKSLPTGGRKSEVLIRPLITGD